MKGFVWLIKSLFHPVKFARTAIGKAIEMDNAGRRMSALYLKTEAALIVVAACTMWCSLVSLVFYEVWLHIDIPRLDIENVLEDIMADYALLVVKWSFLCCIVPTVLMTVVLSLKYGEFTDDCDFCD